jgi:hypothetical protein
LHEQFQELLEKILLTVLRMRYAIFAENWRQSDNIQALRDFLNSIVEKSPIRRQRAKKNKCLFCCRYGKSWWCGLTWITPGRSYGTNGGGV